MPPPQIRAGLQFGPWTLIEKIGWGGNGEVWKANEPTSGATVAVKILTKVKAISYERFKDETKILTDIGNQPGIVPILGYNLPEDPSAERPWYVMPLGIPAHTALKKADLSQIVAAVAQIARAMAFLHERGITHRDVKPANFLLIDGHGCISDFGLVDYPGKADLTAKKEDIGPRWTMVPEVWRHEGKVDGKPADVFSLAKSLWILLTGVRQGFDGGYAPYGSVGLRRYRTKSDFIGPLDSLLVEATEHNPGLRPSMSVFADRLFRWLRLEEEFHERNRLEWQELLSRIFPVSVPLQATWTSLNEIALVLTIVGERSNVNHMFFPEGGGMDLRSASVSEHESGCIEMDTGGIDLVRPLKLTFELIEEAIEMSYFRLELSPLEASDVYDFDEARRREEVLRLGDSGRYVSRSYWDIGEFDCEPLPEGSRPVSRFFNGSFVITGKASPYNLAHGALDAYDGRHDKMSAEKFRDHMQEFAAAVSRAKQRAKLLTAAANTF